MGACSVAPSTDTADTGGGGATGAVAADRTCGEVASTSAGVATGGNEAGCIEGCSGRDVPGAGPANGGDA